jgi:hypothetical protein
MYKIATFNFLAETERSLGSRLRRGKACIYTSPKGEYQLNDKRSALKLLGMNKAFPDADSADAIFVRIVASIKTSPIGSRPKVLMLVKQLKGRINDVPDEEVVCRLLKGTRTVGIWGAHQNAATHAWGTARALECIHATPKVEEYRGIVETVNVDSVVATVSSRGDWDKWDAHIPIASFDKPPTQGQEFSCTVTTRGSDISVRASVLPQGTRRSLNDFGLNKDELFEWASKIDL